MRSAPQERKNELLVGKAQDKAEPAAQKSRWKVVNQRGADLHLEPETVAEIVGKVRAVCARRMSAARVSVLWRERLA